MPCIHCKNPSVFFLHGVWKTFTETGEVSSRIKKCVFCNGDLHGIPPQEYRINNVDDIKKEASHAFKNTEPVKSSVEIILIRFNNKKVEDKAIALVKENTNHNYTLKVVDNYKKKEDLSTLWNRLIEKSKAKYVCLLNSDAFVTDNWLNEIMKSFNDRKVGIAGSSGDKVGGKQKTVGTKELADHNINVFEEIRQLSGFCFVLKKKMWEDVGGFTKEVPFYGGESALCIKARQKGYKLIWAKGSFVYHLHGDSAKKEGNWDKLRIGGLKQYSKWLAKNIPIMFLTYNRLEYTKQALNSLLESEAQRIVIIDNASTDGTQKYLQTLDNKKIEKVIFNEDNKMVAGAMNQFFEMTESEEFIGKVDNDTIVPKNWISKMLFEMLSNGVSIAQPKHNVLCNEKDFKEWSKDMEKKGDFLLNSHVGGSAILIDRAMIDAPIIEGMGALMGWTQYQTARHFLKGFLTTIEIKLLDMTGDNKQNYDDYPDYYEEVGRKQDTSFSFKDSFQTMGAILKRLDEKFAFTRFGDGEIMILNGFEGKEYNQFSTPKLMTEIREALEIVDDNYLIGSTAGMPNEKGVSKGLFERFDNDIELQNTVIRNTHQRTFYSPIALHYLLVFYTEVFKSFLSELKVKKLGLVGTEDVIVLADYLGVTDTLVIPNTQAYDTFEEWYPKVKAMNVDIVLLACGISANVVQKRLWHESEMSTLDIGSVLNAILFATTDAQVKPGNWRTWIKLSIDKLKKRL